MCVDDTAIRSSPSPPSAVLGLVLRPWLVKAWRWRLLMLVWGPCLISIHYELRVVRKDASGEVVCEKVLDSGDGRELSFTC